MPTDGQNNISSSIVIRSNNKMMGKYTIISVGSTDLTTSIQPVLHYDTNGLISVRNTASTDLMSSISSAEERLDELTSDIQLRIASDMLGLIAVKPNNRMYGTVEIKQPPTTDLVLNPTQDAFVRDGIPKLNYGTEEDMFAGTSFSGEIYRSFVQFDITAMPANRSIKKAVLRLSHASFNDYSTILAAYDAGVSWTELGVTWDNQPSHNLLTATFDSGLGQSYVDVDVTQIVRNWYAGASTNFGWVIKALAESNMPYSRYYTKEHPTLGPKLTISHFDPTIVSYSNADLISNIVIPQYNDLTSSVTIHSNNTWSELNGSITSTPKGIREINGSITVNRPDMNGSVTVTNPGSSDLSGSVQVRVKDFNELSGSITPSRNETPGSIYVRSYADLNGAATVRVSAANELLGDITVNRFEIDGSIYVRYYSDMDGSITPRGPAISEIVGNISINRPDMMGSIYVRSFVDLNGSTTIRRTQNSDVLGSASVNRPDILGSIYVKAFSDIFGDTLIRGNQTSELPGTITAQRTDLNDLTGSITVNPVSSIPGSIFVNHPEIPGYISVVLTNGIDSSITPRLSKQDDMTSSVTVRASASKDLTSSLAARVKSIDDLLSSIDVYQTSSIPSSITVRAPATNDLTSVISIRGYIDLPGYVAISGMSDLTSTITVRQSSSTDLNSSINPRIKSSSDLVGSITVDFDAHIPGTITVRVPGLNDLTSLVTVRRAALSEITSSISVQHSSDIDSTVTVMWVSELPGTVEIVTKKPYSFIM